MKIAFIGGGNMGEAMLSAILDKRLSTPEDICVSDNEDTCRQQLKQKYGVAVTHNNRLAIDKRDIVILAIKPQNLAEVMAELSGLFQPNQLVISIIAGARINTLCKGLKHEAIVRAMPNTPARIGRGISIWTATAEVTAQQREWAKSIIGMMGQEIYVDEEQYLDMATAVSGSGPAYFFLFVESLVEAATNIGLQQDIAEKLVLQTMLGSGYLIEKSGKPPAELRRMVTSPGGTTAAALQKLEEGQFTELIKKAVAAAYKRARELGN
ncbi:pyrroline-5-carboxylate reductase [Chloroflexota bacterium]